MPTWHLDLYYYHLHHKCQHGICGVNGNKIGMLIGYAVIELCNLFEIDGIG